MPNHTYKIIELVGSSQDGVESAVQNAVARASETIQHLDWFEVREIRGSIADGKADWYQVKVGIGFRVMEPGDIHKEA